MGPHQYLTLPHLIRLFQEAAMRNSDRLGISTPQLVAQQGLTWVLHRQIIQAAHWPTLGQDVQVLTLPARVERGLLIIRDFYLLDAQGTPLITSTSAWSTMNTSSRRIKPLPTSVTELLTDLPPPAQHLPWPEGKVQPPERTDQGMTFRVTYAHLDFNNHLTNPAFAELMVEPLGIDHLTQYLPRRADITYHREARYGDLLRAGSTRLDTNGPVTFRHTLMRDDELLATMETEWVAR
ncbi:hypothetical protein LEM8419_01725 [Neolewinella maritima]|uniref:Acyl-ACP thioesterase n=1 Tax=Neolewinella maritima TaxID=1383882 RepID=A0ABN8F1G3_9BACT|nr:hypothetical protein LEM8419_01725 [Neolewinella maritima]